MINFGKIHLLFLLYIFQLFFLIGCHEPESAESINNITKTVSIIDDFQSNRLNFKLSTDKDIDNIISMYEQNQQDMIFYFGFAPSLYYLRQDAEISVQDNQNYLKSGKIEQQLTWSIFSKFDVSDKVKIGNFVGTIKAQKINHSAFGIPENFANVLRGKNVYNMARFLTSEAQGQGFGTEACKAYVKHIFSHTSADIIISVSDAKNLASRKSVLACGFQQVGSFEAKGRSQYFLIKQRSS